MLLINVIPKKPHQAHAKKREKVTEGTVKRFWDWPFPPLKLTPTPMTTDESAFEKLHGADGTAPAELKIHSPVVYCIDSNIFLK